MSSSGGVLNLNQKQSSGTKADFRSKLSTYLGASLLGASLVLFGYSSIPTPTTESQEIDVGEKLQHLPSQLPEIHSTGRNKSQGPTTSSSVETRPSFETEIDRSDRLMTRTLTSTTNEFHGLISLTSSVILGAIEEHISQSTSQQLKPCRSEKLNCTDELTEGQSITWTASSTCADARFDWTSSVGQLKSSGASATLDTNGLAGKPIRISVIRTGCGDSCVMNCAVTVKAREPIVESNVTTTSIYKPSPATQGPITVKVSDKAGAVSGASITLSSSSGTKSAKTRSDGEFRFDNLEFGNYTVSVESPRHKQRTRNISLTNTRGATLPIRLEVIQETSVAPIIVPNPPSRRPNEKGRHGTIKVTCPATLSQGWSDFCRVHYEPPEIQPPDSYPGFDTLAAFGLEGKELANGPISFQPLDLTRHDWTIPIEPLSDVQSISSKLVMQNKVKERSTGNTELIPGVIVIDERTITVAPALLTDNQTKDSGYVLIVGGVSSLGFGQRRKLRQFTGKVTDAGSSLAYWASNTFSVLTLKQKFETESVRKDQPPDGVTCYFLAEIGKQIILHHEAKVEVIISREVLTKLEDSMTGDTKQAEVDPEEQLVLRLVPKMNFEVVGDDLRKLALPLSDQPVNTNFTVKPTHLGKGEIWIAIYQHRGELATLVLDPEIVTSQTAEPGTIIVQESAREADQAEESPDELRIFEIRNGTEVRFKYDLRSDSLDIWDTYESDPIQGDRQEYVENIYRQIETHWAKRRGAQDTFIEDLRDFGGEIFDKLFPFQLQTVLWNHRDDIKRILVISEEPFIPWELVYLKKPQAQVSEDGKFLAQMGVVRWLHRAGRPPREIIVRAGRARYVIPKYPNLGQRLPWAEAEVTLLEKIFSATEVEAHADRVRNLLTGPGAFDLLHFACHGGAEASNISNARLLLKGKIENDQYVPEFLTATMVGQRGDLRSGKNRPLVVINACQAGRQGYNLSGLGGFAEAFLRRGAGAFIGTLWSVGDNPARTFSEALYRALLDDSDLAAATIKAREAAREQDAAIWLAYVVYGHPKMKLMVHN